VNKEEKKALDDAKKRAQEANDSRNNDRLKAMEAIADNSEEEREVKQELPAEIQIEEPESVLQEEIKEEAEPEVSQEPVSDSDTRVTNGQTYYRQVVNGREVWQTLKEIRETAQKVSSADEYLRQAAEGARKASELALSQDEPVSLGKDEVRKLLAAQALGDEEAIEKLASLLARPPVDTADVMQRVDQRLSFRTELARLEEKSEDLLKDKYMGMLFRAKLNELKQSNPQMGLSDAYTSIDQELRTAFPGFKTSRVQEKLERKRTLPAPISTGARAPATEEEEGEESYSEVIEKIAQARGGTVRSDPTRFPAKR
jgi:hypothetical protein